MVFRVNGTFPTEFDETTNAVLATLQSLGTTQEELEADQQFLIDILHMVGAYDDPNFTTDAMIHVMDMAYIGLIYHRHMPFVDESTNEKVRLSEQYPVGYTKTLSMLSSALEEQHDVTAEQIMQCAGDAAVEAIQWLRRPETLDKEGLRLHTDFIALCILGLMVHRLIPTTTTTPQ